MSAVPEAPPRPEDHHESAATALQKSRITQALHAMRYRRSRLDVAGALAAERQLNYELDLLSYRLRMVWGSTRQ